MNDIKIIHEAIISRFNSGSGSNVNNSALGIEVRGSTLTDSSEAQTYTREEFKVAFNEDNPITDEQLDALIYNKILYIDVIDSYGSNYSYLRSWYRNGNINWINSEDDTSFLPSATQINFLGYTASGGIETPTWVTFDYQLTDGEEQFMLYKTLDN